LPLHPIHRVYLNAVKHERVWATKFPPGSAATSPTHLFGS